MRKLLVLLMVALAINPAWAQRSITGKVTDDKGSPVINASVTIKGSTTGTVTKADGTYSLTLPSNATTLVISSVDMGTQEITIGSQSVINVTLNTADKTLDEVVVVGYGTQLKRELTGSISTLKGTELENIAVQGPDQALRGRVAGVNVTQSSGTPGSSININIRGAGSISASTQPLYVVDGIPIQIGSYSQLAVGGQILNALADINPTDIESFEVLKDAGATAIYGSRAANGVVLITTKKGANRKTRVTINSYLGWQEVYNKLETITGPEYVALLQEEINNNVGVVVDPSAVGFDGLDGDPNTRGTTNWQDEIFRSAAVQGHDISLSGGNEKTKFYVSASYFQQEGIIIGSDFERYNLRMNIDNNVTDKLKINAGIGLTRSYSNRIQGDNNITGVLSTSLLMGSHIPVFNPDGTYGLDPNASIENPVAAGTEPLYEIRNNRILGNISAEYQIIPSLSFKSLVGVDYISFREQEFLPTTTLFGSGVNGQGTEGYTQDFNLVNENILTFKKTFAEHHDIQLTALASYQESKFESIAAQATNFPVDDINRLSAGSVLVAATSDGSSFGLIGYLARLNYAYRGKYLFSGSVRRDGVSRFVGDRTWSTFGAVSGAWRISDENFFNSISFINDLKIRASYGVAGNSSVGNFASLQLVGAGANFIQEAGLAPTQLGNTNLKWESSEQTDIGLDISFLKSRITLVADYYIRNTDDLLFARPIVSSSGFTSFSDNIGALENKGFELAINSININGKDFKWNTQFNITFPKNKIKTLSGTPFAAGFASWVEEGQKLGSFRGFKVQRIFQTQDEINVAPLQTTRTRPGDIQFVDINGDNVITAADQEILGSAVPDFFGGLTNTFSYKGFELSAFIQFVQGSEIYNNTRVFSEGMNSVFGQTAAVRDRWVPGKTDATLPRAIFNDFNGNNRVSDRWIEDGSFARLKNIVLSYTLPKSITDRLKINSLKFFVQGENIFTWTDYSGFDPEISTFSITNTAPNTDFLTFPQSRNFTFGLNLVF